MAIHASGPHPPIRARGLCDRPQTRSGRRSLRARIDLPLSVLSVEARPSFCESPETSRDFRVLLTTRTGLAGIFTRASLVDRDLVCHDREVVASNGSLPVRIVLDGAGRPGRSRFWSSPGHLDARSLRSPPDAGRLGLARACPQHATGKGPGRRHDLLIRWKFSIGKENTGEPGAGRSQRTKVERRCERISRNP